MEYPTVCGLDCYQCKYFGPDCEGCVALSGRPFWTGLLNLEVCPIYGCCVEQRSLEHCGVCGDFPCETFMSIEQSDPELDEEQAEASAKKRRENLIGRTGGTV